MADPADAPLRPAGPGGRILYGVATLLAIFGGLLSCAMAALVTVSVAGRYLLSAPVPGDYDIVGILCGSEIFAFLPYCQLRRGNVIVDFFTNRASPRARAALDACGTAIYLAVAVMFAWRLFHGMLEMRESAEQISAFAFYRWWTVPFDIFCMIVLVFAISHSLIRDIAAAKGRTT